MPSRRVISVLLVDDHPLFRDGVRSGLEAQAGFKVVGEAADAPEAIQKAIELDPDVILLDVDLPAMSGLDLAGELKRWHPRSEILVLTMHRQYDFVRRFFELGVKGYAVKDVSSTALRLAIRKVAAGQFYLSAGIALPGDEKTAKKLSDDASAPQSLSRREQEVLHLLATASRNKEIAGKLGISVRTVEKHRAKIMKKLSIDNVAGLTRYVLISEPNGPH